MGSFLEGQISMTRRAPVHRGERRCLDASTGAAFPRGENTEREKHVPQVG